ncbi:MAG TPA: glycosyltransferase, partial [Bryobacteraceae bacterium]|nr:glycosyltransferase [Bryobacteraceae bacterium]
MPEAIKVLFASGSKDLMPTAIEHMLKILPELPLVVVSEFPPQHPRWIPFPMLRGLFENLAMCRWHFRDKHVRVSAVILQPGMPYWQMRIIGFLIAPWNFLAFNENFGYFILRPQSIGTVLRHFRWRARNLFVSELSPGGVTYTFLWRLRHPRAFLRPWNALLAALAGATLSAVKAILPASPASEAAGETRPRGISVVIPSRNGKDLLARLLPEVVRQIEQVGGEIIVVDNGSGDRTAAFLRDAYPAVVIEHSQTPLSFARAVNAGICKARYSHVCLLNNDMVIEEGFFEPLLAAFEKVPDLFCATAQIFFPEGVRREETGKAVMPFPHWRHVTDFPIRCDPPYAGEDLSYVLYGSGGCSLYDAGKLHGLGGMDEIYDPAYVEDLDLGFRAWQRGWPSVFVAAARVLHRHQTTTTKYYTADFLRQVLELNYLRFLARAISDPKLFRRLWREAAWRLNLLSAKQIPDYVASSALLLSRRIALREMIRAAAPRRRLRPAIPESEILALASGAVIVAPGRARRNRPVVLVASSYIPFPLSHGGAVRMYNLMRRAARDFDLVLVSCSPGPTDAPPELLEICCEVVLVKNPGTHLLPSTSRPEMVEEFDLPAFHGALRQTVRKWKPAIAQLEFTQMAQYARDCAPAKTILVEHDVTLDLYQQLLEQNDDWEMRRQLRRWIPFETAAWRQVDRVVAMSEPDRELMQKHGAPASSVVCLANGVDVQRFQPVAHPPEPGRLLFIGSFRHLPNLLAVDYFLREVWPQLQRLRPALHIIAGAQRQYFIDHYLHRVQVNLDQPGIEVDDFVADVRPAYERAAIVLAPLVASAGTNIKIMEAMAMGKAIVSTPAGIHGLDLHAGEDVIVTKTPEEMARAIAELIEHPEKRQCLEQAARKTVERDF